MTVEAARKADEAGRAAKKAAATAFRLAEETARKGELAEIAGDKALASAMKSALVKAVVKRLTRWEWIATLVVINLAIVFGAVLFAIALGQAL